MKRYFAYNGLVVVAFLLLWIALVVIEVKASPFKFLKWTYAGSLPCVFICFFLASHRALVSSRYYFERGIVPWRFNEDRTGERWEVVRESRWADLRNWNGLTLYFARQPTVRNAHFQSDTSSTLPRSIRSFMALTCTSDAVGPPRTYRSTAVKCLSKLPRWGRTVEMARVLA